MRGGESSLHKPFDDSEVRGRNPMQARTNLIDLMGLRAARAIVSRRDISRAVMKPRISCRNSVAAVVEIVETARGEGLQVAVFEYLA